MAAGDVIGEAWALYRAHFRHLVTIAFMVFVLIALLTLLLILLLGGLGALVAGFISVAGVFWLQGALVIAVDDVKDGRADLSVGQTLERVRPRLNTLSLAALAALVALTVASLLVFFGLLLFILPGLILLAVFVYCLVRWILVVPVIMLEGRGVVGALGRSSQLVHGHGWSVFGVILVTLVVLLGVGAGIAAVLAPLPDGIQGLVGEIVGSTLIAPFAALAWTLVYFRLRGATEPAIAATT